MKESKAYKTYYDFDSGKEIPKPKEPTFQVSLDVLSLTPFYQAFLITASVPAIYMHGFWAIKFVDPPFEEEILAFIRELDYSGNEKSLSKIKIDTLPQPRRTFGTIINKCLSRKVTRLDLLCLSRAQILWGMYHQKYVDYVYLLWEDLVYQIEKRRNKVDWHMAKDDHILTIIRFIPKHETVQKYSAILPDILTNQSMKESDAYKTCRSKVLDLFSLFFFEYLHYELPEDVVSIIFGIILELQHDDCLV
ncbi:hypothetical protein Tco_1098414 [Tanacetum coccineum]